MEINPKDEPYERVGEIVSIFLRGKKWYANFQLDGKQERRALKTDSKKEARRRAIQIEAEIMLGTYQAAVKPAAIGEAVAAYMELLKTEQRRAKTLSRYQGILDRLERFAAERKVVKLDGVNLRFLDAYRARRVEYEAAPKTIYIESVVIRQVINFALSRSMLGTDPLKGLRLKKPKPAPQPCWTPEEVDKILQAAKEPERTKFLVLAETGMRVGELRWLTWDDVDFANGWIHIRAKDDWQPKTGDRRAIPMKEKVKAALEKLPRHARWVFTANPSTKYPKGDHQISDRHLWKSLNRVLTRLKMVGHPHTFRHAFISNALIRGTAEAIVRQWVGHVDRDVIKLYTHIVDKSSQAAMQRLEGTNESCIKG
jgi:site-specific recombinase XerD